MSSCLQPELALADPPADQSLDLIITILDQEQTWLTAAQLLVKLGEAPTDSKKRVLRELANASQGKIISGQKGYKHIRHATPEEITHAANWLRHQAKEMDARATEILKQYHAIPHTPK
jgi:hypothetical protein